MTAARVVTTYPDPASAREFLAQSESFFGDASKTDNSNEGRALLVHQAAVAACDAVLTFEGRRVTGGEGGLDTSKAWRHDASYRAQVVPAAILADALEATAELLDLVRRHVA